MGDSQQIFTDPNNVADICRGPRDYFIKHFITSPRSRSNSSLRRQYEEYVRGLVRKYTPTTWQLHAKQVTCDHGTHVKQLSEDVTGHGTEIKKISTEPEVFLNFSFHSFLFALFLSGI